MERFDRHKRKNCRGLLALTALAASLTLVACNTSTVVESYVRVQDSNVDKAYIKPGVDFSRYRQLKAFPLEIYYSEGLGGPEPDDLERMRTIFREAFLSRIEGVYPIVDAAGPDVLGVRASLVDAKFHPKTAELEQMGLLTSMVSAGQLSFFMEMTDSVSGEVLARAGDLEKEPDQPMDGVQDASWQQVEIAAARWAGLFRDFLDENFGK